MKCIFRIILDLTRSTELWSWKKPQIVGWVLNSTNNTLYIALKGERLDTDWLLKDIHLSLLVISRQCGNLFACVWFSGAINVY